MGFAFAATAARRSPRQLSFISGRGREATGVIPNYRSRLFLALPPSTDVNETFLREVDEEYRRDKVRDFFVDNRVFLISAIVLFLAATGGWIWWQSYQRERTGQQVEELAKVYRDL